MPLAGEADIIVVGGGSAGCALAGRLADHGDLKILLVEAGKAKLDLNTRIPALVSKVVMNPEYDWMLPVEPDQSTGTGPGFWPAAKRLGGGSAINGMMYIRGHAADYDSWERAGATGWGYADCLPYFKRMETNPRGGEFHGDSGPLHVSESRLDYPLTDLWMRSAKAAGIPACEDLNGDGYAAIGIDRVQASQWKGRRWSTADAYVRSGGHGARIEMLANAQVERILVENGQATGVQIRGEGQPVRQLRAKRGVVLAAGTLATPKLLMLSGIGPADHLSGLGIDVVRDLPGVGRNLQEHVGVNLAWTVSGRSINTDVVGLGQLKAGFEYIMRRSGPLTAAISNAQAMVRVGDGDGAADLQLAFSPFSFDILPGGVRSMPKVPMISMLVAALHPGSRGTLELRSADPAAPPLIRHELLGDPKDLDLLMEGVRLARRIMSLDPVSGHVIDEIKPGAGIGNELLRDWIRSAAVPLFHPVGTCRMGNDDLAVATPDLKVRTLDRLWIADCSIIPELVSANTNATAIMIGEKASTHILSAIAA